MRLLVVALLLQACVSSSIQLGEEAEDSGPDDARALDAGSDVFPPSDASIDGLIVEPDVTCGAPAPLLYPCFEGSCEPVESTGDEMCGLRCDPAPADCFTSCEHDSQCSLGYGCCDGPDCDLVAQNEDGQGIYSGCSANVVPVEFIALCDEEGTCQPVFLPECVDGDVCVVVGSVGPECGGRIALTENLLEAYVKSVCPVDDPTPERCCEQLGRNPADGICNESVCEPVDQTP